jgi:hypothetical protein
MTGRAGSLTGSATPVFVLGTARSGTGWLANLLMSHPDIVGLAATEHNGILESHLLDHTRFALAGEWPRAEFWERYAAEDYARLARVTKDEFCRAAPPRADAVDFFGALMGLVARRAGARYWLEKTPRHAIYGEILLNRFAGARFILLERAFTDTIQSQLAVFANRRAGWLRRRLEKVARYESDARAMRRLGRLAPSRVIAVRYEALRGDLEAEMGRVLRFLELPERRLATPYPRVSSFGPEGADRPPLAAGERALLEAMRWLCAAIPFGVLVRLRERHDRRGALRFPKFRLLAPS